MKAKILSDLVAGYELFIVPLRMGEGLRQEEFDGFCNQLHAFAETWRGDGDIPKIAASVFMDAFATMVSASYLYPPAVGEELRQKADQINEIIRGCCR